MKTELGKILAKWRIDQGINIKKMATEIGISDSYLSLIETGKREPTIKIIVSLSVYTGLDLNKYCSQVRLSLSDIDPVLRGKIIKIAVEDAYKKINN